MSQRVAVVIAVLIIILGVPALFLLSSYDGRVPFVDSPSHIAAKGGHMLKIDEALASGADINAQDEYGKTALHYAAENGHGATTQSLLNKGADATIKDDGGFTPHQLAVNNKHTQTAGVLEAVTRAEP